MESLTKEEIELIKDELNLDVDNPTTIALKKLFGLYKFYKSAWEGIPEDNLVSCTRSD